MGRILKVFIIVLCLMGTFRLTLVWRTTLSIGLELMDAYPDDPKGYSMVGFAYFRDGSFQLAEPVFEKALLMGYEDPRVLYMLAMCYDGDRGKSAKLLKRAVQLFPEFSLGQLAYGRVLLFNDKSKEALPYFQKSLELLPSFSAYAYVMQIHIMNNDMLRAQATLKEAHQYIKDPEKIKFLERFISRRDTMTYPVDIGT